MKLFIILLAIMLAPHIAFADITPASGIQSVNTQRAQHGLAPLATSTTLTRIAQIRAYDTARTGDWTHTPKDGLDYITIAKLLGYRWQNLGENLGACFIDTGTETTAWMNSPEHRANILSPDYKETGVDVEYGFYQGRPCVYVAQEFASQ